MYQGLLALSPKVAILRMSKVYSVRWDSVEPDEAADLSDVILFVLIRVVMDKSFSGHSLANLAFSKHTHTVPS